MRLQPQRKEFDAWIWDYLDEGEPALDVVRDSHWEERQRLSLLELLDILSEVDLLLLKPEFYQGWQDRTERCKTLRRQAAAITGFAIGAEQRDSLAPDDHPVKIALLVGPDREVPIGGKMHCPKF